MPNWCHNMVVFRHKGSQMIEELVAKIKGTDAKEQTVKDEDGVEAGLFGTYYPRPKDEDWYAWNNANWGTKWDVRFSDIRIVESSMNEVQMCFSTAWAPPIGFYEAAENRYGFEIEAAFVEPGMCFSGYYAEGEAFEEGLGETLEEIRTQIRQSDSALLSELLEEIYEDLEMEAEWEAEQEARKQSEGTALAESAQQVSEGTATAESTQQASAEPAKEPAEVTVNNEPLAEG